MFQMTVLRPTPGREPPDRWHVPKVVVHRAAHRLEHLGLITVSEKQPSSLGPAWAQVQAPEPFRERTSPGRLSRPSTQCHLA